MIPVGTEEEVVYNDEMDRRIENRERGTLRWFAELLPSPELVFLAQIIAIYVVLGVSLVNLTGQHGDNQTSKL